MSLVGYVPGLTFKPSAFLARLSGAQASYRLPVYIACTLLVLVSNFRLGKDMAWDTLNYHLYVGLSAVHDRFSQDYFAAGPLSYLNPYAYVPFYALVSLGLPALLISSLFALAHSAILWLTFELALAAWPSDEPRTRLAVGLCAVALTFMNPILIQQIGSSFADITTATLVLGGWLLLVRALARPRATPFVLAGLLLGVATALKLTNAVHAMAAFALFLVLPWKERGALRSVLGFAVSVGVGFALVAAPWAYRLEQMFGNPFFPLMNQFFRSPEFTTEPLHPYRFLPHSVGEALWRPFAMLDPVIVVHEELKAPDIRYALLCVLLLAVVLVGLWRRIKHRPALSQAAKSEPAMRTLVALGCLLGADWLLYLSTSGNSRYFLPMASVAAVVAIALLFWLCTAQPAVRSYILVAVFGIQGTQLALGADLRWDPMPWDGPWFSVEVPGKLATEPYLYLTIGVQSNSFIAPYLAPGSGLINFSGGYALGADGANGMRVKALVHRFAPRVRVLVRGERLYADDEYRGPRLSEVDDALERFALRVDPSDCAVISVHGLRPELEIDWQTAGAAPRPKHASTDITDLVTCRVVSDYRDHSAELANDRLAKLALDHLEDACPQLFQPRGLFTERNSQTWIRLYANSDLTAWVSHGGVKFQSVMHGGELIYLGREIDWATAPPRLDCGRRNGKYFAKVLPAGEGP